MTQPTLKQWLKRGRTAKKRRKPISPVSKRRAAKLREYAKRRKAFLTAYPFCQAFERIVLWAASNWKHDKRALETWYLCPEPTEIPLSTEIHHTKKPKCKYLNDESTWLAVSRWSHDWIHSHPKQARELGLLK